MPPSLLFRQQTLLFVVLMWFWVESGFTITLHLMRGYNPGLQSPGIVFSLGAERETCPTFGDAASSSSAFCPIRMEEPAPFVAVPWIARRTKPCFFDSCIYFLFFLFFSGILISPLAVSSPLALVLTTSIVDVERKL